MTDWNDVMNGFHRARLPARLVFPDRLRSQWDRHREESLRAFLAVSASVESRRGLEEFTLLPGLNGEVRVLDLDRRIRHLVLLSASDKVRVRLLFGHDERHLFIASLGDARVTRVRDAFEILKPARVRDAETAGGRIRRQGEWFFVREPDFRPPADALVLSKAALGPLVRGRDRLHPHVAEEAMRIRVWVERRRTFENRIYARGAVRHDEHATLKLRMWHRVFHNREPKPWQATPSIRFQD